LNTTTLQADDAGMVLQPKDIQQSMRILAGIDQHPLSLQFPLDAQSMNIFATS
jgi:hypothetical protein